MGIVVTLGLLAALFLVAAEFKGISLKPMLAKPLAVFVLLCGFWNASWYGLQHLQQFWGLVALGSGMTLLIIAWRTMTKRQSRPSMFILMVLLVAFFLLYLVTIIRLNLGLPIIS